MTNLQTDESVVANTSGPGKITFEGARTFLEGRGIWLLFFFPEQLGAGDPGLLEIVKGSFLLNDWAGWLADAQQRQGQHNRRLRTARLIRQILRRIHRDP
jgi:hypothetical protein